MTELADRLKRLEEAWARHGAPGHAARFAPGLGREETTLALSRGGLTAPEEILDWFAWHNGMAEAPPEVPGRPSCREYWLPPTCWAPLSLARSLADYRLMRDLAVEISEESLEVHGEADHFWQPTWLPLFSQHGYAIAAELTAERDTVAVLSRDKTGEVSARLGSITELIELWTRFLDEIAPSSLAADGRLRDIEVARSPEALAFLGANLVFMD